METKTITKKWHFQTPWNYKYWENRGEINIGPSITVPDLNLSIQQILDNFSRGISNDQISRFPIGLDNPTFDDIDVTQDPAFDIIEAKQIADQIDQRQKQRLEKQKTIDDAISEEKERLYQEAQKAKQDTTLPLPPNPAI